MKIVLFKIGIRVSTPKPCFIILTLRIIKPVKSALNKQKINLKSEFSDTPGFPIKF